MGRIIGVLNYKGGTGKTTTVINLGAGLAQMEKQVLCVDLDAQGILAASLGVKAKRTLGDLLSNGTDTTDCIYSTRKNLDVIPSSRKLINIEGDLWKMEDRNVARRLLSNKLGNIAEQYDFVIIDFPPSANLISEAGLQYIEELLIPMPMSHLALVGTFQVVGTLKAVSQIPDHKVRLKWIVPTLYQAKLRKDREIITALKRQFPKEITSPIRRNVRLSEAPAAKQTIFEYDPDSFGAKDYTQLAERVLVNDETKGT